MDDETRARVQWAVDAWRAKRAEVEASREALRAELQRAKDLGVQKSELARLLGITRQAIQEFFR